MLIPERKAEFERWMAEHLPSGYARSSDSGPLNDAAWQAGRELKRGGTAVFLCIDREGDIAAGASSSGWALGYPGRLGDSAVIGAGLYADNRYGACGCTHFGEMTIRAGTARAVVQALGHGDSVFGAASTAVRELHRLEGGFIGPVVVHALDFYGNPGVTSTEDLGAEGSYIYWQEGQGEPKTGQAEVIGG
jgi:L-asparaginase